MHPLAIELAKANPAKMKMASVITNKRGRVLSYGLNSYEKTHRMQAHFGKRTGNPEAICLHAELAALVRLREEPHTLYVARVTKKHNHAASKPCPACSMAIREAGVKKVVYFDREGNEVEEWV
jgi:deoxycytidylate deaminase